MKKFSQNMIRQMYRNVLKHNREIRISDNRVFVRTHINKIVCELFENGCIHNAEGMRLFEWKKNRSK